MSAAADEFEGAHARAQTHTIPLTPVESGQERCVRCGAALASDQRYCVECGQRLGRARLPLMDSSVQERERPAASAPPPRRWRASPTTALLAGVGTLLLAMGVGVLIGRSGQSKATASNPPVQVVTVPSGTSAGTATPGVGAESPTTGASSAAPGVKAGKAAAAKAAAAASAAKAVAAAKAAAKAKAVKKVAPPPPEKVVTVGQPGKGPGYEKGKFTGNFFGKGEE
ncbi:MAG: hypothetical protein FWD42_09955 [Solirubrobacterales bacterium]|nr:hypothetical protein [Solirubrobacterales bacterium]